MIIRARIKPGSKGKPQVTLQADGSYMVAVPEPALEGRANRAAIRAIADYLRCAPSCVILAKGQSSRYKTFNVSVTDV